MMHARNFGRFLRQKFAAGPLPTQTGTLSLAKPPAPTPPPAAPKPAMPAQPPQPQSMVSGTRLPQPPAAAPKPAAPAPAQPKPATPQGGNPSFMKELFNPKAPGYLGVLDRWYNPWTKQQVTEKGEHGLMRAGQTAMGIGAGAAAAAGGLAAAAPGLAATPLSQVPAYLAGSGAAQAGGAATAGAGAAAANPRAQQMMPTFANAASRVSGAASSAANALNARTSDIALKAHDLKQQAWNNLPKPAQSVAHWYEHNIGAPIESSPLSTATNPVNGTSNVMNPLYTQGNPVGLVPHSISAPAEFGHQMAHTLGELSGAEGHH